MVVTEAELDLVAVDLSSRFGSPASFAVLREQLCLLRSALLRAAIDAVGDVADTTGLESAYQSLAEVQQRHPRLVADLLCHPNTGIWLEQVIHRATNDSGDRAVPLWADCGYLGWMAAAASIRAGEAGAARLAIRDGAIMLPGLGLARLGAAERCSWCDTRWTSGGIIEFSWDGGLLRLGHPAAETDPRWLPLRTLCAGHGEPAVALDDLDPFRFERPDTPFAPRLDAAAAEQWQRDFHAARELISGDHRLAHYLIPMRECLRGIAPLDSQRPDESHAYTAYQGPGYVYTTPAPSPRVLAMNLIHEVQHTKLALLMDHVELVGPDESCTLYAPWRSDPRPIAGLLHGIYSFVGVADFWRAQRGSPDSVPLRAHIEFDLWRTQVVDAMARAQSSGLLTATGSRFVRGLADVVAGWDAEEVPVAARHATRDVSVAHRTFWSVRNRVPDPDAIAELAVLRAAGRPPSAALPHAGWADQDDIPGRYAKLRLAEYLRFDQSAAVVPRDEGGDRALLAGYPTEAFALYGRDLRADPLCPQAWAGLAVAGPKVFGYNAFEVLREHAEVAAHLYQRMGPDTDIPDLMRWLSDAPWARA